MKTPKNRLTPEEMDFQKKGDSAEIVEWNRQFGLLVAEYLEAVECEDEGWVSDIVCELRKCLDGPKEVLIYELGEISQWLGGEMGR